jgi:hypothetical protein
VQYGLVLDSRDDQVYIKPSPTAALAPAKRYRYGVKSMTFFNLTAAQMWAAIKTYFADRKVEMAIIFSGPFAVLALAYIFFLLMKHAPILFVLVAPLLLIAPLVFVVVTVLKTNSMDFVDNKLKSLNLSLFLMVFASYAIADRWYRLQLEHFFPLTILQQIALFIACVMSLSLLFGKPLKNVVAKKQGHQPIT